MTVDNEASSSGALVTPDDSQEIEYPDHWRGHVVLGGGRTCLIRPVQSSDSEELVDFFNSLSEESLHMRYFDGSRELAMRDAQRLAEADHQIVVALVAVLRGQIIGIGNYDRLDHFEGEVAFAVRDEFQSQGLGSLLLEHLAAVARERGVRVFKAEVLSENKKMLKTFERAGYSPSVRVDSTVTVLEFDIFPTTSVRKVSQKREHRAESLSVRHLLGPRSIAVWASTLHEDSIGRRVLDNLVDAGYSNPLFAIHDSGIDIGEVRGFTGIESVSELVDLVIMAGTPDEVLGRVDALADAGVEGVVLLTGGFAQSEHLYDQDELGSVFRESGIRLIGPEALGVMNTDPRFQMNATVIPEFSSRGRIGVFAHTGSFGNVILKQLERRGLGVSTFMSVGSRADVTATDMVQFWEDDTSTSVGLLHLESMGNPRKLMRLVRRLSSHKPVVVVRTGHLTRSSPVGHAVRQSLLDQDAIDSMLSQSGAIQVDSIFEMVDIASLLSLQPRPRGRGVAVVSDSIPLGALAQDAVESVGLNVTGETHIIDPDAEVSDLVASIQSALEDPAVSSLIVTHEPPVFGEDDRVAQTLLELAKDATKPIVAVMLAGHSEPLVAGRGSNGLPTHGSIPIFSKIEAAVRSLVAIVRYEEWLKAPHGKVPKFKDVEFRRAESVIEAAFEARSLAHNVVASANATVTECLKAYGVDVWPEVPVLSEESAVETARELGYPVVLKVNSDRLVHRLDMGAVRLHLENEHALRTAYLAMISSMPQSTVDQLVVQRMAPPGVACVIEASEDALFGPVVSFRVAGDVADILDDRSWISAPCTDKEVEQMVRAAKASALLVDRKFRPPSEPGRSSVDELPITPNVESLEQLILRVVKLKDDFPEVNSIKLNPVIVHATGVAVIDARGTIGRAHARTDLEARRLS